MPFPKVSISITEQGTAARSKWDGIMLIHWINPYSIFLVDSISHQIFSKLQFTCGHLHSFFYWFLWMCMLSTICGWMRTIGIIPKMEAFGETGHSISSASTGWLTLAGAALCNNYNLGGSEIGDRSPHLPANEDWSCRDEKWGASAEILRYPDLTSITLIRRKW